MAREVRFHEGATDHDSAQTDRGWWNCELDGLGGGKGSFLSFKSV